MAEDEALALPDGYLIHQAVIELRYREGIVYLDRCGSTMVELSRKLGESFATSVPGMEYAELSSSAEWLTVRYGPQLFSVTQVGPTTLARFQSVATAAWPIIASKLEVRDKVLRCGFRLIIARPAGSQEESEQLIKAADLFAETAKWDDIFRASPVARSFVGLLERHESKLRIAIGGVQHQVDGNAPSRLLAVSPPHAVQIDLDFSTERASTSQQQLSDFIRSSWMEARQLVRRIL